MNFIAVAVIVLLAVIGIAATSLDVFIDPENADAATFEFCNGNRPADNHDLTKQIESGSDSRTYTSYQQAVIADVLHNTDDRIMKGEVVLKGRYFIVQRSVWEWASKQAAQEQLRR